MFLTENKNNWLIYIINFIISLLLFRSLFVELRGDEWTYYSLANNLLQSGNYQSNGIQSTIIPSIPFLLYLTSFINGELQVWLVRLMSSLSLIIGMFYIYKYFKLKEVKGLFFILPFILVNHTFINSSSSLYPDALIFMLTWMVIYYISRVDFYKSTLSLLIISFSIISLFYLRYIYIYLLPLVFYFSFGSFKELKQLKYYADKIKLFSILSFASIFILVWVYYLVNIETGGNDGYSYLSRFSNGFLKTISDGLGFTIAENHSRHNGIPAFISMFIPITGIRSWFLSILLIAFLLFSMFYNKFLKIHREAILIFIFLYMILLLSGTGFSRYWLSSLPLIYLAFFNFLKDKVHLNKLKLITLILITLLFINELRITYLILN